MTHVSTKNLMHVTHRLIDRALPGGKGKTIHESQLPEHEWLSGLARDAFDELTAHSSLSSAGHGHFTHGVTFENRLRNRMKQILDASIRDVAGQGASARFVSRREAENLPYPILKGAYQLLLTFPLLVDELA